MASATPVRCSIDHSSSDHSDRLIPWSQIVRGKGERQPLPVRENIFEKQPYQQKIYFQERHNEELDFDVGKPVDAEFLPSFGSSCSSADSWIPVASSSPSSSLWADGSRPLSEAEAIISPAPDGVHINSFSANEATNVDTSYGLLPKDTGTVVMDGQINATVSRPAWKKVLNRFEDGTDLSATGAMSWPALSAVCSTTKSAPPVMEMTVTQGLPLRLETGNTLASPQQKPPVSHGQYRNGPLSSHENLSDMSSAGVGLDYMHQSAKVPSFPAATAAGTVNGLGSQERTDMGPAHFSTDMVHRRPLMRNYGRGVHGWNSIGRSNAYSRNGGIQLQHQKIGPRNIRVPSAPFVGPNLGFMPLTGFQNPYGTVYYMPTPPNSFFGATYYGVPGYHMPALEPMSLEQELLKQIEYYFSVENLCKDIYLRSHMDSEGFVPVGVIASFNRVRSLSQNPTFILDVLRESTVVEVQGEGIRKRDGWMQWLPQPSWQCHTSSSIQPDDNRKELMMETAQEKDSPGKFSRALNDLEVTEAFSENPLSKTSSAMDDVDAYANSISSLNLSKASGRTSEEPGKQTTTKSPQFANEQLLTQTELNGTLPSHHNKE